MTIGQYEILRNRLDGIIGSESRRGLKVKRLHQMLSDLIVGFDKLDRYANDLMQEIIYEIEVLAK